MYANMNSRMSHIVSSERTSRLPACLQCGCPRPRVGATLKLNWDRSLTVTGSGIIHCLETKLSVYWLSTAMNDLHIGHQNTRTISTYGSSKYALILKQCPVAVHVYQRLIRYLYNRKCLCNFQLSINSNVVRVGPSCHRHHRFLLKTATPLIPHIFFCFFCHRTRLPMMRLKSLCEDDNN